MGLLETETPHKKAPKTQNRNKFHPKSKTEIKPLSGNALVGFRISLSAI